MSAQDTDEEPPVHALFRPKAVSAQLDPTPTLAHTGLQPLQSWLVIWLLVMVCLIVLTLQLSYTQKVSVSGTVQPTRGVVAVRSPQAGVVSRLQVNTHDFVQAQTSLLVLDQKTHGITGESFGQLHISQLQAQQRDLRDQWTALQKVYEQQGLALAGQLKGLHGQQLTQRSRVKTLQQRLAVVDAAHAQVEQLAAQKWISQTDLQSSQAKRLTAQEAQLDQLLAQQAIDVQVAQLLDQQQLLKLQAQLKREEFKSKLRQLEHEIHRVGYQAELAVTAPVAGRVDDVLVHTGQRIERGELLLNLLPADGALQQVEAFVPATAAGKVRQGMPVRVRFAGYPYPEYGSAKGRVVQIAQASVANSNVYRAKIALVEVPAEIESVPAGMQVDLDIQLHRRALWQWLSLPLTEALMRI